MSLATNVILFCMIFAATALGVLACLVGIYLFGNPYPDSDE